MGVGVGVAVGAGDRVIWGGGAGVRVAGSGAEVAGAEVMVGRARSVKVGRAASAVGETSPGAAQAMGVNRTRSRPNHSPERQ